MKYKIKDLFRRACNKLFLMMARGILEKKSDGSIHIFGDVVAHGNITGGKSVNHHAPLSEKGD